MTLTSCNYDHTAWWMRAYLVVAEDIKAILLNVLDVRQRQMSCWGPIPGIHVTMVTRANNPNSFCRVHRRLIQVWDVTEKVSECHVGSLLTGSRVCGEIFIDHFHFISSFYLTEWIICESSSRSQMIPQTNLKFLLNINEDSYIRAREPLNFTVANVGTCEQSNRGVFH